ncbi:hypothetical protein L6R52_29635 [Myxococcota bacterium]|nr:hypothetical protein [Myxococcota bacterium]
MLRAVSSKDSEADGLASWAENQRALARTLGLTIEDWLAALDAAGTRTTGLTAAVVGAAMARGLGLSVLDGLDGPSLAARARALIDPRPPRVESPLLKEAIRRATELGAGTGASRLKRAIRPAPSTDWAPEAALVRETKPLGDSSDEATPDAPGRAVKRGAKGAKGKKAAKKKAPAKKAASKAPKRRRTADGEVEE